MKIVIYNHYTYNQKKKKHEERDTVIYDATEIVESPNDPHTVLIGCYHKGKYLALRVKKNDYRTMEVF